MTIAVTIYKVQKVLDGGAAGAGSVDTFGKIVSGATLTNSEAIDLVAFRQVKPSGPASIGRSQSKFAGRWK